MRTRYIKGAGLQEGDVWVTADSHMYLLRNLQPTDKGFKAEGDELGRVRSGARRRELLASFGTDEDVKILMTEE